jgi:RNA polymerase sigma factor (sigma-70 family)
MPHAPFADFLDSLYRLYPEHDTRGDGELVERFATLREDAAFTVLVRRHGRMVQGVCQRILGDGHWAEDALQATFVVLARRASSLHVEGSLATWLYGVAQRVALRAKAQMTVRRDRERKAASMRQRQECDDATWEELRPILDEEVARLAEKYRAPIVLCHFQGKSRKLVAQELGLAEGTVARRLERGRGLLRQQLQKRGITLSAGALCAVLTEKGVGAPLAATVAVNTVSAAVSIVSGKMLAAGCLSAQALALAEEAMGMFAIKSKLVLLLLAIGLVVGGASYGGFAAVERTSDARQQQTPAPEARGRIVNEEASSLIAGVVVDEAGKAVAGVDVELKQHEAPPPVATGQDGSFQLRVGGHIYGTLLARFRDGELQASLRVQGPESPADLKKLRLVLKPARRVDVVIKDGKGNAVADAHAGVVSSMSVLTQATSDAQGHATLRLPADGPLDQVYAWKHGMGFDYRSYHKPYRTSDPKPKVPVVPNATIELRLEGARALRVTVVDGDGAPIKNLPLYPWYFEKPGESTDINTAWPKDIEAITDENGVAEWDWLPLWQKGIIQFWPRTKEYHRERLAWDTKDDSNTARLVLERLERLSGKVTYADGKPAAGIVVRADGAAYTFDGFRGETKTRPDGTYELRIAPNQVYLVVVIDKNWAADPQTGFAALPKAPLPNKDFVLRPATKIFGRLTLGTNQRAYAGQYMYLLQFGKDLHSQAGVTLPNPEEDNRWVQPSSGLNTMTDAEGRYEFSVGPGEYQLRGPDQVKHIRFKVTDEAKLEFNFHAPREETALLKGSVVIGTPPVPVVGASIEGVHRLIANDTHSKTDRQGRFEAVRHQHSMTLCARSADGKLAGIVEIGPEATTVKVPIVPVASARGRLVDSQTGEPLPGREIIYAVRVPSGHDENSAWTNRFGGTVKTDDRGRFELAAIVAGHKYDVNVTMETEGGGRWATVHTLVATPGQSLDLGEVKFTPNQPPRTMADRRRAAFEAKGTPLERFEEARRDAGLSRQRVLVVLAPASKDQTEQLFAMTREREELSGALDDFRTVWVATDDDLWPAAQALAKKLGRELTKGTGPLLVITDERGERLALKEADQLKSNGNLDVTILAKFLRDAAAAGCRQAAGRGAGPGQKGEQTRHRPGDGYLVRPVLDAVALPRPAPRRLGKGLPVDQARPALDRRRGNRQAPAPTSLEGRGRQGPPGPGNPVDCHPRCRRQGHGIVHQ